MRAGVKTRLVAAAAMVLGSLGLVVTTASPAAADGPTTFSNTAAIAIPATGSANQTGPASPYPSNIAVSGMTGAVTKVTVTFANLTHGSLPDVDAMVVAPTGQNLVVMSDVGPNNQLSTANNATYTFDDAAAAQITAPPVAVPSGSYRPTNNNPGGTVDTFPAPAPTPSTNTTLAQAFTGINPNGTWQLFVVDDATGDLGSMAGGWSITVTTEAAAVATTTTVTTSQTPSQTGSSVTFTAAVRAGATPVTAGTVQFESDGTNIGGPLAVNASGQASLTTSALAEGSHLIRATFSGATGFLTSNGTVAQRVDNPTVVTGNTFCNTGTITGPDRGQATPYPSHVTVTGVPGSVTKVTAQLKGLSHTAPIDFDILLSAPDGTKNVVLMSDAGGQNPVSNLNLTFDDAATGQIPVPAVSGTFLPTDIDPADSPVDTWPAPAPGSQRRHDHGRRLERHDRQRTVEPVGRRRRDRGHRLDLRRLVHHGVRGRADHDHPDLVGEPVTDRPAGDPYRDGGGRCQPGDRRHRDLLRGRDAPWRSGAGGGERYGDPDHLDARRRFPQPDRDLLGGRRVPAQHRHVDAGRHPGAHHDDVDLEPEPIPRRRLRDLHRHGDVRRCPGDRRVSRLLGRRRGTAGRLAECFGYGDAHHLLADRGHPCGDRDVRAYRDAGDEYRLGEPGRRPRGHHDGADRESQPGTRR